MGKTLKFELIKKLGDDSLIKGVGTLYNNSESLLSTGKLVGESGKYGLAVALVVLSIEELIKANALFLVLMEASDENLFDAAFNSKNLHATRLKLAEGLKITNSLIEQTQIEKSLEEASKALDVDFSSMSPQEILKMDWLNGFIQKLQESQEFNNQLEKIVKEIVPEAEAKMLEQTDWLVNAQGRKEKGMYVDFNNSDWHSPSDISEDDYREACRHSDLLFNTVGKPIYSLISSHPFLQVFFLKIARDVIREARNKYK